jgi:hypothetical protein
MPTETNINRIPRSKAGILRRPMRADGWDGFAPDGSGGRVAQKPLNAFIRLAAAASNAPKAVTRLTVLWRKFSMLIA